jgi:hypothetical protein
MVMKALVCRNAGFDCHNIIRENIEDEIMAVYCRAHYKRNIIRNQDILLHNSQKRLKGLLPFKNPLYIDNN